MVAGSPPQVLDFGEFRLDRAQRLLFRRATSEVVPLTPRVFNTLLYLVEHPGELVKKTELLESVWQGVVVEESSLAQAISTLRHALGESPGEHRYIVTETGRGYRFVAAITIPGAPAELPASQARPRRRALLVSIAAAVLIAASFLIAPRFLATHPSTPSPARLASIAVATFENQTGDASQEYFARGMSDELIEMFTHVGDLKVIPLPNASATPASDGTPLADAQSLGATHLLTGGVQHADQRVRISVQLIDVQSRQTVWAQPFEGKMGDLFAVQDAIAIGVAYALLPSVGGTDFGRREPPTSNVTAYKMWLEAREAFKAPTHANLRNAVSLLQQATQIDPEFAEAWTTLSGAYARIVTQHVEIDNPLPEFDRASREAIRLNPNSPAARRSEAILAVSRGRWLAADRAYEHAKALEPVSYLAQDHALNVFMQTGQLKRARTMLEIAERARPDDRSVLMHLAVLNSMDSRDDDALRQANRAIELGYPADALPMPVIFSEAARRAGRFDESVEFMIKSLPESVRSAGGADEIRAIYQALRDPSQRSAGLAGLRRLERHLESGSFETFRIRAHAIIWYTLLGARDDAYRLADGWLAQYRRAGFVGLPLIGTILWQRDIPAFRSDPRFRSFIGAMEYLEFWKIHGPPDACSLREMVLTCDS